MCYCCVYIIICHMQVKICLHITIPSYISSSDTLVTQLFTTTYVGMVGDCALLVCLCTLSASTSIQSSLHFLDLTFYIYHLSHADEDWLSLSKSYSWGECTSMRKCYVYLCWILSSKCFLVAPISTSTASVLNVARVNVLHCELQTCYMCLYAPASAAPPHVVLCLSQTGLAYIGTTSSTCSISSTS